MLLFVLIAEMEQVYLISPDVDNTHRAKVLQEPSLDPLLTHGPREHWQIHPQWEDRLLYITLLVYLSMSHIICISLHVSVISHKY